MTTLEFMQKYYQDSTRVRTFGSILVDSFGDLYSYGYHYPLLFTVSGRSFINTRGWSVSTARHIRWAWTVAPDATPVELDDYETRLLVHGDEDQKIAALKMATDRMVKESKTAYQAKRKGTQISRSLWHAFNRASMSRTIAWNL